VAVHDRRIGAPKNVSLDGIVMRHRRHNGDMLANIVLEKVVDDLMSGILGPWSSYLNRFPVAVAKYVTLNGRIDTRFKGG
jgi:hypothetical protein